MDYRALVADGPTFVVVDEGDGVQAGGSPGWADSPISATGIGEENPAARADGKPMGVIEKEDMSQIIAATFGQPSPGQAAVI